MFKKGDNKGLLHVYTALSVDTDIFLARKILSSRLPASEKSTERAV